MATKMERSFSVSFDYGVTFTRDLFNPNNLAFRSSFSEASPRLVVVVDGGVARAHPAISARISAYAEHHGCDLAVAPVVLEGGEQCKNSLGSAQAVLELLDRAGIDRHSYLVAIGGGAILDMAGFAAAICHRGVRLIRVPTTVLAQNDSGVGVKNSLNLFGKKNFLGTFAVPTRVLNDAELLVTLDDRDWFAGCAEAVKVALLKDPGFFSWLERCGPKIRARDLETMERLIRECARLHMDHISTSGDPFERGSSRPLDFGHWAAHRLEQLTGFEVRHGEAVSIGLCLDVAYSVELGRLTPSDAERIFRCLRGLGLPCTHAELRRDGRLNPAVLQGLAEFREHLGGRLTLMMLEAPGRSFEVHEMDDALLDRANRRVVQWLEGQRAQEWHAQRQANRDH